VNSCPNRVDMSKQSDAGGTLCCILRTLQVITSLHFFTDRLHDVLMHFLPFIVVPLGPVVVPPRFASQYTSWIEQLHTSREVKGICFCSREKDRDRNEGRICYLVLNIQFRRCTLRTAQKARICLLRSRCLVESDACQAFFC
jgi:hypothetical protein